MESRARRWSFGCRSSDNRFRSDLHRRCPWKCNGASNKRWDDAVACRDWENGQCSNHVPIGWPAVRHLWRRQFAVRFRASIEETSMRNATRMISIALAGSILFAAGPIHVMILDGESGGPSHQRQPVTLPPKKALADPRPSPLHVVT